MVSTIARTFLLTVRSRWALDRLASAGQGFQSEAVAIETLEMQTVGVVDDGGLFVLACAETADGSGRAVIFSNDAHPDRQDRALGMDAYCVSTELGATSYGGVTSAELGPESLVPSLTDEAAVELAPPTAVRLEFDRIHAPVVGDGLERLGLGA